MSAVRCTLIGLAWFLTALLQPLPALACNVPVFRYALERWSPDAFVAVVFHREPLASAQQALVDAMEKTSDGGSANFVVRKVNVSGKVAPSFQTLWKSQTNTTTPWLVVRYPAAKGIEQSVWAGSPDAAVIRALVDSPARRELARRLQTNSAVWLLLESGNRSADDAAARLLETESRSLEQSLTLPEADPGDPQMRSELPLKIAFSTLRVSRTDPAERMLVNMLLHIDEGFPAVAEPMVFGVMGRGHALPPLIGKEIGPAGIRAVAEFVIGPCSCQVKELNPGFDLLMAADWEALLAGREMTRPELPPLVGLSQFAAAVTALPVDREGGEGKTPSFPSRPSRDTSLLRNLVLVFGIGIAFVAATSLVLKTRAKRKLR